MNEKGLCWKNVPSLIESISKADEIERLRIKLSARRAESTNARRILRSSGSGRLNVMVFKVAMRFAPMVRAVEDEMVKMSFSWVMLW